MDNLKELTLKTPTGQPLKYKINTNFFASGRPMGDDERLMLQRLEEEGAIKIIRSYGNNSYR
ncbi:MAG: hypothetical protein ABIC36_02060 [bacterium]